MERASESDNMFIAFGHFATHRALKWMNRAADSWQRRPSRWQSLSAAAGGVAPRTHRWEDNDDTSHPVWSNLHYGNIWNYIWDIWNLQKGDRIGKDLFFHCFFGVKILFPCAIWWSFFYVYCVSLHSSKSSAVRRFGRGWTAGLSKQQVIGETARRVLHDADKVMLHDVTWIATVVKHGETWWNMVNMPSSSAQKVLIDSMPQFKDHVNCTWPGAIFPAWRGFSR